MTGPSHYWVQHFQWSYSCFEDHSEGVCWKELIRETSAREITLIALVGLIVARGYRESATLSQLSIFSVVPTQK